MAEEDKLLDTNKHRIGLLIAALRSDKVPTEEECPEKDVRDYVMMLREAVGAPGSEGYDERLKKVEDTLVEKAELISSAGTLLHHSCKKEKAQASRNLRRRQAKALNKLVKYPDHPAERRRRAFADYISRNPEEVVARFKAVCQLWIRHMEGRIWKDEDGKDLQGEESTKAEQAFLDACKACHEVVYSDLRTWPAGLMDFAGGADSKLWGALLLDHEAVTH